MNTEEIVVTSPLCNIPPVVTTSPHFPISRGDYILKRSEKIGGGLPTLVVVPVFVPVFHENNTLSILYQCFFLKKREPGTACQALSESLAQRPKSLAGVWYDSLEINCISLNSVVEPRIYILFHTKRLLDTIICY